MLATTICLIVLLHFVFTSEIQTNFLEIEQKEVTDSIGRIQVALANRYAAIDSDAASWSQLNATYNFIQDQNSEYHDTYLTVSSVANIDLNFVLFLEPNGNFVTGMGLNLTTMQKMPIPTELISQISDAPLIWDLPNVDSRTNGFLLTSDGPLLIAARPILMTDGRGPVHGTLVFARYYDADEIQKLSYIMKFPMSLELFSDWVEENSLQNQSLTATYIKPINQQFIAGYDIVSDIRGQPIFAIAATMPRTVFNQGLEAISYIDESLIIAGIVFSIIIVLLMQFSVLRKLGKLTDAAVKLGKLENTCQELPVSGNDEITWLALSINGLLQEIQRQNVKLKNSERLATIGELSRQIGHDLRNPLTSTKNAAYYLRIKGTKISGEARAQMLDIIEKDIARSDKTISDLIEYSSDVYLDTEPCSPKTLLVAALAKLQVPSNAKLVDLTSNEPTMLADANKLQRVFSSIIKNAIEAMPNGGKLKIQSRHKDQTVQIDFEDTGTGIPKELLPKIFTPLLTTKAQGMGFSLAICKRIVECHGGEISVESVMGKGTTFRLTLPVHSKDVAIDQKLLLYKTDPLLHYKCTEQP